MGPVVSTSSTPSIPLSHESLIAVYKEGNMDKINIIKKRFDDEIRDVINAIMLPEDIIRSIKTFLNLHNTAIQYIIKELDIIVHMRDECHWSNRTINLLRKEKLENDFKIVDDIHKYNKIISMKTNHAVPCFYSNKQTFSIGYKDTIDETLVELLKMDNPFIKKFKTAQ